MKLHMNYYRLCTNPTLQESLGKGAVPCTLTEADSYNRKGYDIFWTFNGFEFGKRTKPDLKYINAFYLDLDAGSKQQMLLQIRKKLEPTFVISTGKGYHAYWVLEQEIDCSDEPVRWADWFREFLLERMQPAFNADPQACDACRLLRPAFFKYWKDGKGIINTDIVFESDRFYSLGELEMFFPKIAKAKPEKMPHVPRVGAQPTGNFWERANNIDVKSALEKLSGTEHVNGETYKLKPRGDGTIRVWCNRRPANVWIDRNGKIGSTAGGGPAIPNWLFWYKKDWKAVAKILEKEFAIC